MAVVEAGGDCGTIALVGTWSQQAAAAADADAACHSASRALAGKQANSFERSVFQCAFEYCYCNEHTKESEAVHLAQDAQTTITRRLCTGVFPFTRSTPTTPTGQQQHHHQQRITHTRDGRGHVIVCMTKACRLCVLNLSC
jgi:hypothetical protein